MVVDDNDMARYLMREVLEPVGFTVIEARDGAEALGKFAQWQPDLIFMDQRMPGMNGYETTRQIIRLEGGQNVPVIMLTADILGVREDDESSKLFVSVISKPFDIRRLFSLMQDLLGISYIYARQALAAEEAAVSAEVSPLLSVEAAARRLDGPTGLALYKAAVSGDMESIQAIAAGIEDPELADAIHYWADEFDYASIISLCEGGKEERQGSLSCEPLTGH
jgi:CheY-like chemotaxis protein